MDLKLLKYNLVNYLMCKFQLFDHLKIYNKFYGKVSLIMNNKKVNQKNWKSIQIVNKAQYFIE